MNLPSVFIRKRTRWSSYPWGSPDGKNQWHWHFFIVVSLMLGLWRRSTAAVNCLWPRAALEMGSCLWTVCLHWAPIEQGHSRLNQSRVCDVVSTFRSKEKQMWCMWWDNWCLPQNKSGPTTSSWQWHEDLCEVCVRMYDRSSTAEGIDDARLEMFSRKQRPASRAALLQ